MGTRTYSRRSASGERILTRLGRERASQDTAVFNPATLPITLQKLINYSHRYSDWSIENAERLPDAISKEYYDRFGLDITKQEDRHLMADLFGFFGPKYGSNDFTRVPLNLDDPDVQTFPLSIYYPRDTFGVDISRYINDDVLETSDGKGNYFDLIQIINNEQFVTPNAPAGFGYMQLARQLAAAREVVRRTGKAIEIFVYALNESEPGTDTKNIKGTIGALVWPKMGHNFEIPPILKNDLQDMGFTESQVQDTATLMLSQTSDGLTGYDAWDNLLSSPEYSDIGLRGKTRITPDDVRNNQLTLAERVTQAYGRRKGFLKSAQVETDAFTDEDNNTLREIWRELARERR